VDITLCLYSVLSHLPVTKLPRVATEIARVTKGHFVTTVRSTGSPPTAFVDSIEAARRFEMDHDLDRCEIEFHDGRRMALRFHLFTADELRSCFAEQFEIEDLCGLDIFHGRFSPDARWHPAAIGADPRFSNLLAQLEARWMHNSSFMARATHLMLVGLPPLRAIRSERPKRARYRRHATARVPAPISKPPPARLTARCTPGRRMVRRAADASSA